MLFSANKYTLLNTNLGTITMYYLEMASSLKTAAVKILLEKLSINLNLSVICEISETKVNKHQVKHVMLMEVFNKNDVLNTKKCSYPKVSTAHKILSCFTTFKQYAANIG